MNKKIQLGINGFLMYQSVTISMEEKTARATLRSDVCGVLIVKYPSKSTNWTALLPYNGRSGHMLHISSSRASRWLAGELLQNFVATKSNNTNKYTVNITNKIDSLSILTENGHENAPTSWGIHAVTNKGK